MSEESQSTNIKLECRLNLENDFQRPDYARWKELAQQALKGASFEKKLVTRTYEGIDLQPIYIEKDSAGLSTENPGSGNHMRGTSAAGYMDQSWEVCQEIEADSPAGFNQALLHDLQRGQTGINILLNKLPIHGVEDLETALDDVAIDHYPLHIISGHSVLEPLMMLRALLEKKGVDLKALRGSIDADPLCVLAATGSLPLPMDTIYTRMAHAVKWAAQHMPNFKTVAVCGLPYHNAGADAVHELAFVMATAVQYIDGLLEQGIHIDNICNSMRFTFGIGPFYFMEIAKLRAARMLWTRIVKSYGAGDEAAKMMIHGKTSTYNQTHYDPYVNMLRTTTEAFSAVVGGVDSLCTNPFDETLSGGDDFSRRAARNTQIILNEECRLDRLIDPAGGSYLVEKLTHDVAKNAWKKFQHIDSIGGMLEALKKGEPQEVIKEVVSKRKTDAGKRKTVIVGTNFFADVKEEKPLVTTANKETLLKRHNDSLNSLKESRSPKVKDDLLESITQYREVMVSEGIDFTSVMEAGKTVFLTGGTLDEVVEAANVSEGENVGVTPLNIHRLSELFEQLRNAVETYKEKNNGAAPRLFLAAMGTLSQYKGRADFSQSFFEVGGFDVITHQGEGYTTAEDAAEAAAQSGAGVAVICSTDETYPQLVPPFIKSVKEKKPGMITVLAGYPKDQVEQHRASGIDEFIFLGANAHQILTGILTKLGVL